MPRQPPTLCNPSVLALEMDLQAYICPVFLSSARRTTPKAPLPEEFRKERDGAQMTALSIPATQHRSMASSCVVQPLRQQHHPFTTSAHPSGSTHLARAPACSPAPAEACTKGSSVEPSVTKLQARQQLSCTLHTQPAWRLLHRQAALAILRGRAGASPLQGCRRVAHPCSGRTISFHTDIVLPAARP